MSTKIEVIQKLFDDDKFFVVLQPVGIDIDQVIGYEVLVRLEFGGQILNPDMFLSYIIENGFSAKLNLLLLGKVIKLLQSEDCKRLLSLTRLKLSINLAPSVENFLTHMDELLSVYEKHRESFNGVQLEFEITENQFMPIDVETPDFFLQLLNKVHQYGIRLALDDFGVAHSSFQRLMACRFDTVKLDLSFIKALDANQKDQENSIAVFEAINFYAKKMNIDLVVEGVETIGQLQVLQKIGYKYFQGYIFGRSLSFEETFQLHLKKLDGK